MKTYAAYYDDDVRIESSSGGLFSCIAEQFDVVYGVAMSEDCYSCGFIRTDGNIQQLRGSKYFQAKVGDTFRQVKDDLIEGKKVLFSGTGCQINGLYHFLGKAYANLFLLDVVCHGVPSPKLWREYVHFQEAKMGKLKSVNFRCKDAGWKDFGIKKNEVYISKEQDSFMRMFLRNYCLRPSCYECHAKHYKKSDMSIADFWGIENVVPEINDGYGISLVLCRTEKGENLFKCIQSNLIWKEVSYKDGIKENPSEYSSVVRPPEREHFFIDLAEIPFNELEKKYAADREVSPFRRMLRKCKLLVMKWGGV